MSKLIYTQLTPALVKITCEGGYVRDKRSGITFREIVCKTEDINNYGEVIPSPANN